jgi:hypothetical protein
VIFAAGFEAAEGYSREFRLGGQRGWRDSGFSGNGVLSNFFGTQGQEAFLGFNPPTNAAANYEVSQPINFQPFSSRLPYVTFSVQMAIFSSTTNRHDDFRWSLVNTEGDRLFSIDFDGVDQTVNYALEDGDFRPTGVRYDKGVVYPLRITLEFERNLWSASLGSIPIVFGQPITQQESRLDLGHIAARWAPRDRNAPGDNFMVFDDYRIGAEPQPASPSLLLYSTSFEASEGFQTGAALADQAGWQGSGSGGNGIATNFFTGETQTAFIGFTPPTNENRSFSLSRRINYRPLDTELPVVNFSVLMAVYDSTSTNRDDFVWRIANTDGKILAAVDFNNVDRSIHYLLENSPAFTPTGLSFSNGTPYTLNIRLNFAQNRWSADLNGASLLSNQPLTTTNSLLSLASIGAQWVIRNPERPGDNFMVFDNYRIEAGPDTPPQPALQINWSPERQIRIRLEGEAGADYALEASTDLVRWELLTTLSSATGISEFTDPGAGNSRMRFYRARLAL